MTDHGAVVVDGLSKCFQLYGRPSDRLKQALFRGRRNFFREFWALRDVSFELPRGKTLGVVGANGSGKSTLLQILAGTLEPTSGSAKANGRVAALLELGAGFSPEFTGRENVYLAGAIAGLTRADIDERMAGIEQFAAIGDFVDRPVNTYSTGMFVRLAFAVATAVEPEILIVDEALAVGDEAFQRKCFARIDALRSTGTTVLFVSHSAATVVELCDTAILLDRGEMLLQGEPKLVVNEYQRLVYCDPAQREALRSQVGARQVVKQPEPEVPVAVPVVDAKANPETAFEYPQCGAEISAVRVTDAAGDELQVLRRGERYTYRFRVRFSADATRVRLGMLLKTVTGLELGGATTGDDSVLGSVSAGQTVDVSFGFNARLAPGDYHFNAGVFGDVAGESVYMHRIIDAVHVKVVSGPGYLGTGLVDLGVEPQLEVQNARQVS